MSFTGVNHARKGPAPLYGPFLERAPLPECGETHTGSVVE